MSARAASAQAAGLPECSLSCFAAAVNQTTCSSVSDFACLCSGANPAKIEDSAIPCLCHSECTTDELLEVVQDTNSFCSSAVATYSAATFGLGACATATTSTATATGTGSGAGATSTSGAQRLAGAGALGVAGLAVLAL
ncbi:GPI anchored CFEM domain-containing protein [Teratosphaeria destructans]|uniref:GPI anchored CFEM domain-containing protein n=1 Tax=Teratosphaeria destructans TaxID=418781 RepID=A0A9W7SKR8_9PEZI|nr:GPI anchored CFEM domain-containing protein [Teratosphaeria destructans]